tara:strand:+ start:168 stop:326 length:159 start_codon:yes stop_codon:yes gene_type:complete
MNYKVYSGKPADLEAGSTPFLEAAFKTKLEAENYVKSWTNIYDPGHVIFWID